MTQKDLDLWWNGLGLNSLMGMFQCPNNQDANDFIDDCDEYWFGLSKKEKQEFYNRHK